ncbi:Gfo/Idh/MocA family oxidoreductase [Anabaena cylindrica FACHB-243]|uniref:Glucose-fructose oxidoreductase n=1 Tax=Anabaena cylindrica (strain ATCC 27899 / PCC 7122) TaxID=272123 RepID=K9ZDQ0_ANACC|nr:MULTISPECIES: Gfo/Idh/MocA family oxidoreductase [Anabaena]AFZ56869.1 Glucose-fructose oxidoreductase [Anabaena cylindrica PCC 7122]MBD2419788.1 Gfo/Idh/MocA family oxidoreductase [Anabaena cylindrica FACHB-243]MBY5311756.1 Gfo/Idh/MocA family oxidoreductase [Anabaena sp. CCAP 1446/1C]MCM2409680.1 Gfo/Idh/MocA family oxidoreductase [Anabaena sp. CCAP 1446/1C]BAY06176.1 oxidoreductase domain-containing protein [Anabaena cylindrica PCC 7122]
MTTTNGKNKIRYAVVGLGWFAQEAALPAFTSADNSELVALVSDDPTKREELSKKYGIQHTYSYDEYEDCLTSGDIDAVYIALPNHLHCDYTVRAANQAIHVLCEKPMAVTEKECEAMMKAANDNGVKLMIAYRLHLEQANLQAVEIVRSHQIGEPRLFNSVFSQQVEQGNIRLREITGGGTIYDIGIYCINAARYLFQDEPTEVFAVAATKGEQRFSEVEEMTSVILRFPNERLATFTCSFGAAKVSNYQVVGTKGDIRVESAYTWQGEIKHYLTIDGETQERTFESHDQLAAEFSYFSDCILQNKDPEPSGIEGLNDVRIIVALYQSIETGQPMKVETLKREQRPTSAQTIERPATEEKPELIHAASPAGN